MKWQRLNKIWTGKQSPLWQTWKPPNAAGEYLQLVALLSFHCVQIYILNVRSKAKISARSLRYIEFLLWDRWWLRTSPEATEGWRPPVCQRWILPLFKVIFWPELNKWRMESLCQTSVPVFSALEKQKAAPDHVSNPITSDYVSTSTSTNPEPPSDIFFLTGDETVDIQNILHV